MNKTARYLTILLLSLFVPIAMFGLPFATASTRYGSSGSVTLSQLMGTVSQYSQYSSGYLRSSAPSSNSGSPLAIMLPLFVIACCLLFIFSLCRTRGGVITASVIGIVSCSMIILLMMANFAELNTTYTKASVGVGPFVTLGLLITTLSLASSEKKETVPVIPVMGYVPYPVYPPYPPREANPYGTPPYDPRSSYDPYAANPYNGEPYDNCYDNGYYGSANQQNQEYPPNSYVQEDNSFYSNQNNY